MAGGNQSVAQIPREELLDEYYENLHGAYNALREGFAASGLTQDHMACALDVDKSLVSRRLNGSENLTLKTLSYMGSAMGCRIAITFIPYSMVGVGNSYTYTPSAKFSTTSINQMPMAVPANKSESLEQV
jgi:hypothetical protein